MSDSPDSNQWQLLGGSATWRAGYAYGARYPSLVMTLQGEKLDRTELAKLATQLIAALPDPGRLTAQWVEQSGAEQSGAKKADGFGGIVRLVLLAIAHLQTSAGVPVFEAGRVLSQTGVQAEVLVLTSTGSYQLVLNIMNWLMQACGLLRSGQGLGDHAGGLARLLEHLEAQFGTHLVSCKFAAAALAAGMPFGELPESAIQYGQGHLARRMLHTMSDETSNVAVHLSRLKHIAAQIMREAGIPVPVHRMVYDEAGALQAAAEIGYPVVVKPADLDGGTAVSSDLRNPDEVRQGFAAAVAKSPNVLVEKHVQGRDYRLTVFQGDVIWVTERLPGGVTGDGRTSVQGLVDQVNNDPRRHYGAHSPLKPLALNDEARYMLRRENLTVDSVPTEGSFIRLRRAAMFSSGALPVESLDLLHPDNARLAVRAANAMGLDIAGIDLLIPDLARSWLETGAAICDVNSGPGIRQTRDTDLYHRMLTSLVQGTGRIPIILIVGAAPDSPLERLVTKGLRLSGMTLGYQDRLGTRVGKERLTPGPVETFIGGRMLVRDPRVEAIVMQVNDDSLLGSGLPFARFDLLIIAGEDVAAANPEQDGPAGQIAMDVVRALLPACDGKVVQLRGTALPLDAFTSETAASWEASLHPGEVEQFLQTEIRLLAKTHQAPVAKTA